MDRAFGRRWVERTERNIVGARFPCLHRKMAAGVTGLANLCRGTEERPGRTDVTVILTEVHAISTEAFGKANAVVDDECDVQVLTNPKQGLGKARKLMLLYILDSKLECSREPWLERCFQSIRK